MSDRRNDIDAVVQEARGIMDANARARFLERECAGNAAMRARVEKMLAEEAEAVGFPSSNETIETPGRAMRGSGSSMTTINAGSPESALPAEKPGAVIGRYKLLQQIGEGGFGVVYMAEQEQPVRRKVALKIIKLGMDTRQVIVRFEAERQALALMDHPNIAKVLDGGATDAGRPYFVMELVKGIPITTYCDKQNMSVSNRLRLFVQVCNAVQHAHQKGIIHRDLKPGNVLVTHVDDKPVPKVIDFGIAKATQQRLTEHTLFTQFGQFMGTPAYMSPEQADPLGLDIDTRSDIYSLGVLLYELLTGATPFEMKTLRAAGVDELKRMIREQDPPRPSTRLSTLGDELPTVAKRRGLAVKGIRTVLRGDLDWIILRAMEKDRARRYETANAFALDIERYLDHEPVHATPPSTVYRFRKFARRNRAALTMATVFGLAVVAGLVVSAYGLVQATRERDAKIEALAATESALSGEQAAVEEQRKARAESDAVAEFLGSMLIAAAPHERGRETTVRSVLDAAAEGLSARFAEQPLVKARLDYLIASTYQSLGLYREAELHSSACLETRRKLLGNDHPDTFAALMALAWNLQDQGRVQDAEPLFVEMREHIKTAGPSDDINVLWSKNQLATSHMQAGRYAQAETLYKEALSVLERVLGKKDRRTLSLMNNLMVLCWNQGQIGKAADLARETYPLTVEVVGPKDPLTIALQVNLAILEYSVGNYARSEEIYLEALAAQTKVVGETNVNSISIKTNMVVLYNDMKEYEKAEANALDVITTGPKALGPDHQLVLGARINLALTYLGSDRVELAVQTARDVLPIARRKLGLQHPWTWEAEEALYRSLVAAKNAAGAASVRSELLGELQPACAAADADANVLDRMARTLMFGDPPSESDVRAAVEAARRAVNRSSRQNPMHLHTLAQALSLAGDKAAAEQTESEAIDLLPVGSAHRATFEAARDGYRRALDG